MGPTGTPTEIEPRRDGRAGRRRPGQRGAVLDRPGVPRGRLEGALLRRLQEDASTATRSPRSRPRPTWSSGAATRRRASRPTRPQDRAFVGNIVQAMAAYAAGELGAQPIPLRRRRPHHRHRLGPHDGGGRRARATTVLAPYLKPRPPRDRLDQLADAMHDEGDLRAVPAAAARSGDRQGDATCSPASTRTSRSTASTSTRSTQRLRQNSLQEKLTAQWIAARRQRHGLIDRAPAAAALGRPALMMDG